MKMELRQDGFIVSEKSSMPVEFSVERLKRAHALRAKFENIGLPPEIELELERRMGSINGSSFLVRGSVEISC